MCPRIGLNLYTILQAATEVADEDGLESLTITTLANKLTIKPPSLYNHVKGLQDLKNKLALYGMQQLYKELNLATEGIAHGEKAIKKLAISYINFARNHPGLYEATLAAPDLSNIELQTEANKIVELTLECLSSYHFEHGQALHIVRGLRSVIHGFASLEQKGGFGLPFDINISLELLIDTYLAGIRSLANTK
ncbi:TetR/AcrR family transcriptional regulator [Halalkalibacter okhensis]|uniref:TetR family transcriptional regulator n=1 Tax=Halalkalibacter okhensis TaxID=333138 RepID=A0A0B0ID20_9BACI|nr:TetR/AcrR family transcriptional regulator [Halalkalibacter okhensis]KHF37924.1 TetR family transcriptional regulator [Halalkalibacter okhensis]